MALSWLATARTSLWAWQGNHLSVAFTEQTGASNPFNGMLGMQACHQY